MSNLPDFDNYLKKLDTATKMVNGLVERFEQAKKLSEEASTKAAQMAAQAAAEAERLAADMAQLAEAMEDWDLQKFFQQVDNTLTRLHQVAEQAANNEDLKSVSKLLLPESLFKNVNDAFSKHIAPKLEEIHKKANDPEFVAKLGNIAVLAKRTFDTSTKVLEYRDKMNTEEQIYAVMGTVLMVAGVAALIAATVNPVTGPAVIGITVAAFALHALGNCLCRRAIARHVEAEPQAKQINEELNEMSAQVKDMSQTHDAEMNRKARLSFAADGAPEASTTGPLVEEPKHAPSLMERVSHIFDIFKPK